MMFGKPIPEANDSFLSNADALVKLIADAWKAQLKDSSGKPIPVS